MPPIVRSIVAVVVGFLVIAALSIGTDAALVAAGVYPPGGGAAVTSVHLLLLATAYVGVYAIFGCWLAAFLAPSRPMRHALILGALGLAFNVISFAQMWNVMPHWFSILNLAVVMPYAWIGGRLRERQLEGTPGLASS